MGAKQLSVLLAHTAMATRDKHVGGVSIQADDALAIVLVQVVGDRLLHDAAATALLLLLLLLLLMHPHTSGICIGW